MLSTEQDDNTYRVSYRAFWLAALLLTIPPLMIYELGGRVIDGSIDSSDLVGLAIAVVLPLVSAYYLVEFASFTFTLDEDRFCWRWSNLIVSKSGEAPLRRIVRVRRDALEASNASGIQHRYRLIVVLDDDSIVPLTRSFSRYHERQLDQIAQQIREHLGLFEPQR